MLTDLQKRTAKAVVNVIETSRVLGDYGKVTLLATDSGHLTYGRSQTTLASGNLHLLIKAYCEAPNARFADPLSRYLSRLAACNPDLDTDARLRGLLSQAGDDPVMRRVQDEFFDRVYWSPSANAAAALQITEPLGVCVVYDSHIQGSWGLMRDRTNQEHGRAVNLGQRIWIERYVEVRKNWLANHSKPLLRKTVYRMEAFETFIGAGKWALPLPISLRGVTISESTLAGEAPTVASAEPATTRTLLLRSPRLRGDDVTEVQRALTAAGFATDPDGVFGKGTDENVQAFQRAHGLKPDGIVGPATRSALGLG